MIVHRLVNSYRSSNTYFVYDRLSCRLVVVDPGWPVEPILTCIKQMNKTLAGIVLTHEHADHCAGVNGLIEKWSVGIYCSSFCAINIRQSNQNYSRYVEEIPTFEILHPSQVVSDWNFFSVGPFEFRGVETPGHSPGGMCILMGAYLFSGDTILACRTPLNFPHSNKASYRASLKKLETVLTSDLTILPGHGEPFQWNNSSSI